MNKLATVLLLIVALASPSTVYAYYCEAISPSALGAGWSGMSMNQACSIALHECSMRTHWTQACFVSYREW